MPYAVKKGEQFKSLYGWTNNVRGALQFRTESDARSYADENGAKDAEIVKAQEPAPYGVRTDYDPFGVKRHG